MLSGILRCADRKRQPAARNTLDAREITGTEEVRVAGGLQQGPHCSSLIVPVLENEPATGLEMCDRLAHDQSDVVQTILAAIECLPGLVAQIALLQMRIVARD